MCWWNPKPRRVDGPSSSQMSSWGPYESIKADSPWNGRNRNLEQCLGTGIHDGVRCPHRWDLAYEAVSANIARRGNPPTSVPRPKSHRRNPAAGPGRPPPRGARASGPLPAFYHGRCLHPCLAGSHGRRRCTHGCRTDRGLRSFQGKNWGKSPTTRPRVDNFGPIL